MKAHRPRRSRFGQPILDAFAKGPAVNGTDGVFNQGMMDRATRPDDQELLGESTLGAQAFLKHQCH